MGKSYSITAEDAGKRIDAFVSQVTDLSRSAAANLTEEGHIQVNGKAVKKNYKLACGDVVEVTLPEIKPLDAQPQEMELDIVYEDSSVIVINKPKGLVVHPAPGNEDHTLVNGLLAHCSDLSGIGGVARPGIVHRIDKETSGLLIVAKNDDAHKRLSAQLKDRSLSRTYHAVVLGCLKQDEGTIEAPLDRSPKDRKKMAVVAGGRHAVTHYEVLARYPGYTYVKCKLETGRTHQIRVHMAYIGHPIAGDVVYGNKSDKSGLVGQCLHAAQLVFIHPATGQPMTVEAPLPDYFSAFLHKLEKMS